MVEFDGCKVRLVVVMDAIERCGRVGVGVVVIDEVAQITVEMEVGRYAVGVLESSEEKLLGVHVLGAPCESSGEELKGVSCVGSGSHGLFGVVDGNKEVAAVQIDLGQ